MKKNVKFYLLLSITALILLSCSKNIEPKKKNYTETIIDGTRFINNTTTPLYKNFDLKLKKLYTINGISDDLDSIRIFTRIIKPIFDSEKNIYITDAKTSSIKKFDKMGRFIRSIGKRGSGPGEIESMLEPIINKDTLLVYGYSREVNRFKLNGEFISKVPFVKQNLIALTQFSKITDSSLVAYAFTFERGKKEVSFILKTNLFDYNIKEISNIFENVVTDEKYKEDPYKYFVRREHVIACKNDKIYITNRNNESYKIIKYSTDGLKEIEITKNFRKIKYTKEELEDLVKLIKNPKELAKIYSYKPAIYKIQIDKSENIWANTFDVEQHKKQEYDVFDKKGIFIGEYKVDFKNKVFQQFSESESIEFFFENDLLVIIDYDKLTVNVYEYEIEMS